MLGEWMLDTVIVCDSSGMAGIDGSLRHAPGRITRHAAERYSQRVMGRAAVKETRWPEGCRTLYVSHKLPLTIPRKDATNALLVFFANAVRVKVLTDESTRLLKPFAFAEFRTEIDALSAFEGYRASVLDGATSAMYLRPAHRQHASATPADLAPPGPGSVAEVAPAVAPALAADTRDLVALERRLEKAQVMHLPATGNGAHRAEAVAVTTVVKKGGTMQVLAMPLARDNGAVMTVLAGRMAMPLAAPGRTVAAALQDVERANRRRRKEEGRLRKKGGKAGLAR